MKLGVNILNFGRGTTPETLEHWARLAEDLGFDFAMVSDHVTVTPDVEAQYPAPFYDQFTLLGWLAGVTSRIELGTSVTIVPYRHPLQTARIAANLDQFSNGRFIFGVGAGWAKQEFAALGVPFHERGAITDEYLEVIRKCWTQDVVSHHGRYVSFDNVHTGPRPVRLPHPPIWVGGSSDAALRRAVRFGDAWHPLRFRIEWMRQEALPKLRRIAQQANSCIPAFCPRILLHLTNSPLDESTRLAGQGTMDQVRADLEALVSLGAQYILLDTYAGPSQAEDSPERDWTALALLAGRPANPAGPAPAV